MSDSALGYLDKSDGWEIGTHPGLEDHEDPPEVGRATDCSRQMGVAILLGG